MKRALPEGSRRRTVGIALAVGLLAAALGVVVPSAPTGAETITQSFSYSASAQTWTVPSGVSSLTVTLTGGQGGLGGGDSQGSPTPGGYRGVVTGTIPVTPGQVISIGVGGGGGTGVSSRGSAAGGAAGQNPFDGYDGSAGGIAGPAGSSGGGGGGGAATVVRIDGTDIVAGGAGGNGGNGQYLPIVGRRAEDHHLARPDGTTTVGRPGMNTADACSAGFRCDGGASGAGGGGAQGGERGAVQYGGATATEYFGFGGYPGSNSTASFSGLTASYEFYAGNGANGSVVFSYESGTPAAPGTVTGTAQTNAVALSWTAPAASGSAPITDYVVQYATAVGGPYTTFADGTSTDLETTVTGLTNGVTYFFRVAAVNAYGTSAWSTTAVGVVPSDVPNAPVITGVVPQDGAIAVDFTPGATNSPILSYEYRLDGGEWLTGSASGNRLTVSGLTNGQSYSVEIRAVNAIGPSAASAPQSATPRAAATAPSGLTASATNGAVALEWTAPTSDNGAPITDYRVEYATAPAGPFSVAADGTSTATSALVTGLTNGTTYYFRVAAVNAAGAGTPSSVTGATPYTVPAAPGVASVTPGDGTLAVGLTAPSDGGSDILRYEYRLDGTGAWHSTGDADDSFVVAGLVNGTSYGVEVRAVNIAGAGPASSPVTGTPRTVPAAPTIAAVALDTGAVGVTFAAGSDGGSPITNYEYSIDGGATWVTRTPASVVSPLTISGLVGGQSYGVALRAVNAAGTSDPSNVSTVTAKGTPSAPVVSGIVGSDRTLSIAFSTPANGGTPITSYEYSIDGGTTWTARTPMSTASPIVVTGLTNGTSYPVRVRAVNAVGAGTASAAVTGTPRTTPGAPTIDADTIVGVDGNLDVVFTPPASDGGSPITTYQYSTDAGATWRTRDAGTTASPLRITTESGDGTTPLTGGATYPVELRAVNAAGPGAASAVANGITTTRPDAPVIEAITTQDGSARVDFTIPANGGAAITAYEYRVDGGPWVDTGTLADEFVVDGLSNGGTYAIEVRAVNVVGAGLPSDPETVRVQTTPAVPFLDGMSAGDRQLTVAFTPTSDGGADVETYEYSTDGGATWRERDAGTTASPLVITRASGSGDRLVNGTLYAVQIRAVNAVGAGDATHSILVAPAGPPAEPTGVTLEPGDGVLRVSFTAGADGGSAVTAVEYRLDGAGWVDAGSLTSPFTIGGLTNGTTYDVAVRTRNAVGAGAASATVSGTPRTIPSAPSAVTATVADSSTTVSWTAPASNGGTAITGYEAVLYDVPAGGTAVGSCTTSGATTCSIGGLTNGTTVYAAVTATNAAGAGPSSSPRVAVTPATVPTVTIAALTPGAHEIVVDTTTQDGGAPVTAYEYRLDGGAWQSAATASEPFTISGLTTGTAYQVEVRARNAVGAGPASAPVSATPRTVPGVPSGLTATRGDRSVALEWEAPASTGGAAISDYVVQYATSASGPFGTFADGTSTATTATVTGLTNGTTYFFRVAAANVAGTGTATTVVAATPMTVPQAPTITGLTSGSHFLQVAFTPGASNGGSAVTGYQYQLDGGSWVSTTTTTSPITVSGLTNGHAYTVAIRSLNAIGSSATSNSMTATPYGLPGAVAGFVAAPGASSVTLSWDAVDDNGSPITAYNIIRWSAATEGSIMASYQTTNTSYTVTGLGAGTYYFTIEATNAAGTGARSAPRTSARVGSVAPGAPTIDALVVDGDAVTLAWTRGSQGDAAPTGSIVQFVPDVGAATTVSMMQSTATSTAFDLPSTSAGYALRVATISSVGVGTFTTIRPPLVADGRADGIGADRATLHADVDANTGAASAWFEYATDSDDLGTVDAAVVDADPATVTGATGAEVTAALTDLEPGTTYFVRARASSGAAVTSSVPFSFTTDARVTSSGLDAVYSGDPVAPETVTEPAGLHVSRTYEGIGATTYGPTSVAPRAAGTYRVVTTVDDDSFTGSETATLTITPRPVTVHVSVADKTYDGTTEATASYTIDGAVAGDDVRVDEASVTAEFADADAGADKPVTITAGSDVLTGADAASYTATVDSEARASIAPAEQSLAFTSTPPAPAVVGATYDPTAVSSAGLEAQIAVDADAAGVCALDGTTVTFTAAGTCTLVATQPGTANVLAAEPVVQELTVQVAAPEPDPSSPPPDPTPDPSPAPGPGAAADPAPGTGADQGTLAGSGLGFAGQDAVAGEAAAPDAATGGSDGRALDRAAGDAGGTDAHHGKDRSTRLSTLASDSRAASASADAADRDSTAERWGILAAVVLLVAGAGLYAGRRRSRSDDGKATGTAS
jgi:hypothetical protein